MKDTWPLFLVAILYVAPNIAHPEQEFKVITEEGVPVAVNPAHPVPAADSPRDIRFEEELTLGTVKGDPCYIFGDFIRFAVDAGGNVYVLDRGSRSIRKFSASGDFLLQFGRPGQGPGEFQMPDEIRFLSNGNLVVFDGEGQRFSVFQGDGSLVESRRFLKLMFPPYFGFSRGNFIASHILYGAETISTTTGLFDENGELIAPLHRTESKLPTTRKLERKDWQTYFPGRHFDRRPSSRSTGMKTSFSGFPTLTKFAS